MCDCHKTARRFTNSGTYYWGWFCLHNGWQTAITNPNPQSVIPDDDLAICNERRPRQYDPDDPDDDMG